MGKNFWEISINASMKDKESSNGQKIKECNTQVTSSNGNEEDFNVNKVNLGMLEDTINYCNQQMRKKNQQY